MLPANDTPFVLERFCVFDKEGAETLVVVLKATFDLAPAHSPTPAKQQDPIVPVDIYAGEPGKSGLLGAADLVPEKPGTGVTVAGHAVAKGPGVKRQEVGVRVGELMQSAVVFGNRSWDTVLGLTRISGPEPFQKIPLTWENAFGGADQTPSAEKHWEFQPDNHVGKGFFARKTRRPVAGAALPNIEHPRHLVGGPRDRPPPVGFCPVAPNWQPRSGFAGTYDDRWREERAPLLPDNFDARYYQTAPAGLSASRFFSGGEACVLIGLTPQGRLEFILPTVTPGFRLCWPTGALRVAPRLDTVHIDTNRMKLNLVWRAATELHGRLDTLETIEASLGGKGAA